MDCLTVSDSVGGLNILLCLIYVEKVYEVPFSVESAENRAADVKALELKSAAPPPVSSSSLYIILKMSFCNSRYFIGVAVGICWGAFCNGVLYTALPLR